MIERINVGYRQSRRLSEFARALGQTQGYEVSDRAPDHMDNLGYQPVLGLALAPPGPSRPDGWQVESARSTDNQ